MPFDRSKFIGQYKSEVKEHLENLTNGLLKLEKSPSDKELPEFLMREAHTIKGSSTMMGFKRIADIAHQMEDGLEKIMHKEIKVSKPLIDQLFKCMDAIPPLLNDKVTWPDNGVEYPFVENLCRETADIFSGKKVSKKTKETPGKKEVKSAPEIRVSDTIEDGTLRIDIKKLDSLMNMTGELLISNIRLTEISSRLYDKLNVSTEDDPVLKDLSINLKTISEAIDTSASSIQENVMGLRLMPVSNLFRVFPRTMRDLAASSGKKVDLKILGGDTELDKGIVDELRDPLMHILRNSIDHGIENPEQRKQCGKDEVGKITLEARQQGAQVKIEIQDDGGGINLERVKNHAIAKNLLEPNLEPTEEQLLNFIFMPGFSTKEEVTEISGRGVGLDVVKNRISKLKGIIDIESTKGVGTKFILKLPLTLAITESLIVILGRDNFAIPIDAVVETLRVDTSDVKTVEGKEVVSVRGKILPLIRLADIFNLPKRGITEKKYYSVVIVQAVEKKIALLVDELLGRYDVVRKNISRPLNSIKDIFGATILGDGKVVLMLDVASIIENTEGRTAKKMQPMKQAQPDSKKKRKTILLAEDVLSTATLEKNILESVGYSVVIARDGQDAFEKLSQERFDMLITDVLMPRMNGFELVEKMKKDKLHRDIPVIIVTTRESDSDKRRGMEAGADAYILKSEFTGEGLLETIERLIG